MLLPGKPLTADTFVRKYNRLFADNTFQLITEATFREFAADIATVFGVQLGNVPEYAPGIPYQKGFLVRYTPAGGNEAFYYSRKAGVLPAPGVGNTAEWKVVPGPTSATALSQRLKLLEAQNIQGDQVVAGRLYLIDFGPDGDGHPQTVNVRGISNNLFDVEGTLEVLGAITPITDIDVFAGTYLVKGTGGGGGTTPTPPRATFGNLGGQATDNKSLVDYVASLGHALKEYVPPMAVELGVWYITPTGIWDAKTSFNGSAAPAPGAYWRQVAAFGTTTAPAGSTYDEVLYPAPADGVQVITPAQLPGLAQAIRIVQVGLLAADGTLDPEFAPSVGYDFNLASRTLRVFGGNAVPGDYILKDYVLSIKYVTGPLNAAPGGPSGPVGFADLTGVPGDNAELTAVLEQYADATDQRLALKADKVQLLDYFTKAQTTTRLATKQPTLQGQEEYQATNYIDPPANLHAVLDLPTSVYNKLVRVSGYATTLINIPDLPLSQEPAVIALQFLAVPRYRAEISAPFQTRRRSIGYISGNETIYLQSYPDEYLDYMSYPPTVVPCMSWAVTSIVPNAGYSPTAGAGIAISLDNVLSTQVPTFNATKLTFTQDGEYAPIYSGTFTVDATGAKVGSVVFVELGAGATQPALPAGFELEGGSYVSGKRHSYGFRVSASGMIRYTINQLP
jgi:hypothetical protein